MTAPKSFTSGDTVRWTETFADYPASSGWSAAFYAVNSAGKFSVNGSANGASFDFSISATTSASIAAGSYTFETYVSKAGERFRVDSGSIEVRANLASSSITALDTRSHARKTLDAIEATIEGRATSDQLEYTIGNRSLKRTPIADLIILAEKYRAMVKAEEAAEAIAQGRGAKNRILVRF